MKRGSGAKKRKEREKRVGFVICACKPHRIVQIAVLSHASFSSVCVYRQQHVCYYEKSTIERRRASSNKESERDILVLYYARTT